MGDAFRKVRPGDPLKIPATVYNAMLDTIQKVRQAGPMFGRTPAARGQAANVALAKNVSGEPIPWHAPVSITGALAAGGEVLTVDKPGDAGPYGIAVDPIPVDGCGLVALAGGPWKVRVTGQVAAGDTLAPAVGQWAAQAADVGDLESLTDDSDDHAWVRFKLGHTPSFPLTLSCPLVYLYYTQELILGKFTLGGKTARLIYAACGYYDGTNDTHLTLSVHDGVTQHYSMSSSVLAVGTEGAPLATCLTGVEVRLQHAGGASFCWGFATFLVT